MQTKTRYDREVILNPETNHCYVRRDIRIKGIPVIKTLKDDIKING